MFFLEIHTYTTQTWERSWSSHVFVPVLNKANPMHTNNPIWNSKQSKEELCLVTTFPSPPQQTLTGPQTRFDPQSLVFCIKKPAGMVSSKSELESSKWTLCPHVRNNSRISEENFKNNQLGTFIVVNYFRLVKSQMYRLFRMFDLPVQLWT
jgi:hypothetical protein